MNRTPIEYADFTWNPVSGCFHACDYCYARPIANRFKAEEPMEQWIREEIMTTEPLKKGDKHPVIIYEVEPGTPPWPFGFTPTFYHGRIDEPKRRRKPSWIFTGSVSDLWGRWVPKKWQEAVLNVARSCPEHQFLFLTKNPKGYLGFEFPENVWLGISADDNDTMERRAPIVLELKERGFAKHVWASLEPLHGEIYLAKWLDKHRGLTSKQREQIAEGEIQDVEAATFDWIVVGAETGPRAHINQPEWQWIDRVIIATRSAKVPLFLKDNAAPIVGRRIQEHPRDRRAA